MMIEWRRILLVTMFLATTAACGSAESDEEAFGFETRHQAIERICGADKYQGPQGVDVSTYQQNFDWVARKNAGVVFGIARVSNGTQIIDDYFDRNWREMKSNGILRGAYQYFRPGQDATAQANIMVDKLGRLGPGDLPAVIDVETSDGQSPAVVREKVRTWLRVVEEGTGKRPMIYTGAYFWRDEVGETGLGDYPLWIANYGADCPLVPEGWDKWTLWQYCDGNPDYCSNGQGFDRNVFNGSMEELEALAGTDVFGAEFVEQSFPFAADPMTMVTGEVVDGYIELRNNGTLDWTTDTKLATTEPRDRDSAFAHDSWPAPNRPAQVEGTVAPGEVFRFEFSLKAPDEPGTYNEYFGVVQEGAQWFSDPGQAGPPDDQLQIAVEVVEGDAQMPDTPDMGTAAESDAGHSGGPSHDPNGDVRPGDGEAPSTEIPPLLSESPGLDGGCAQSKGQPSVFGLTLFLLGLLFSRSRRR